MIATERKGEKWGMDTYEHVVKHLRSEDALLSLRILWEHKKCMHARITHMEEKGYLDPSRHFSRDYAEIEKNANLVRMIMLRVQLGVLRGTRKEQSENRATALLREIATVSTSY